MSRARFSKASTKSEGVEVVMIHADSKRDAKGAIQFAKMWVRAIGGQCKTVYFHEIIGSEWSSMGRRYVARIAYKVAS